MSRKPRPKVYVAGPITARTYLGRRRNVMRALRVGERLIDMGYAPFVPHLDFYYARRWRRFVTWQTWLDIDTPWVRVADALLRIGGASRGADLEMRVARRNGVPVFTSVDDLEGHFFPGRTRAEAVESDDE